MFVFLPALCSERGLWVHGRTGVLTGARGLCFGADMGKNSTLVHPILQYESGVSGV